jgi:cytochrome b
MSGAAPAGQAVWDLPTRLFHWLLVALISFSWWSIEYHHTEWHIWSGIAILTLLVFRLLWGLVGSSTARFANFVRGPSAVIEFVRGESGQKAAAGHTPLGALSVVAMLLLTAAQVGLGLFATDKDGLNEGPLALLVSLATSEGARDLHETLFYVLLGVIALHIAAIVIYRLRGKRLTSAMIGGRAQLDPDTAPMRPARWWVAVLCALLSVGIARWVVAGAPPFSP